MLLWNKLPGRLGMVQVMGVGLVQVSVVVFRLFYCQNNEFVHSLTVNAPQQHYVRPCDPVLAVHQNKNLGCSVNLHAEDNVRPCDPVLAMHENKNLGCSVNLHAENNVRPCGPVLAVHETKNLGCSVNLHAQNNVRPFDPVLAVHENKNLGYLSFVMWNEAPALLCTSGIIIKLVLCIQRW